MKMNVSIPSSYYYHQTHSDYEPISSANMELFDQQAASQYREFFDGSTFTSPLQYTTWQSHMPQQRTSQTFATIQNNSPTEFLAYSSAFPTTLPPYHLSAFGNRPVHNDGSGYGPAVRTPPVAEARPLSDGPEKKDQGASGRYRCALCTKALRSRSALTTHERGHRGDRRFECRHCERRFVDQSTLTKHVRTHTGEKPYRCTQCDAAFAQSGNLRRHVRRIHN